MSPSSCLKHIGVVPAVALILAMTIGASAATPPIVRQFPTPGGGPEGLAFVDGNLWLWDVDEPDLFYVLDPEDGTVLASYPTPPTGGPTGLAYDGQFVYGVSGPGEWLAYFAKFSSTDGSVIEYFDVPVPNPAGITFDGTDFWVSELYGHQLVRIDHDTTQVVQTLTKEPYFSLDLAWGGEALWLAAFDREGGRFLYEIDPGTGETLEVFDAPGAGPAGMAISGDLLFVSDVEDDVVYVLAIPEPSTLAFVLPVVTVALVKRQLRHGG